MLVSSKGEVTDAIEVPDNMGLYTYFRVRVFTGHGEDEECVGEEDFQEYPSHAQIVWSVLNNHGSYAKVVTVYVPQVMPECDECCECCDIESE